MLSLNSEGPRQPANPDAKSNFALAFTVRRYIPVTIYSKVEAKSLIQRGTGIFVFY